MYDVGILTENIKEGVIMKKIFIILLIMLVMPYANAATPSKSELIQTNDKFKEASYRLESGIDYRDFSTLASDLYVIARKFNDTFPDDENGLRFIEMAKMYNFTKEMWSFSITERNKTFPGEKNPIAKYRPTAMMYRNSIINFYPDVAVSIHEFDEYGGWYIDNILVEIFSGLNRRQDNLNKYVSEYNQ